MVDIDDLKELYCKFISAIESTTNSHASLKQKTITRRKDQPRFKKEALISKIKCRKAREDGLKQELNMTKSDIKNSIRPI